MTLLYTLYNKFALYALVALFLFLFLYQVYKAGGDQKELERLNQKYDAVIKRNKVEDDVDRLTDDAVTRKLREMGWFRER